MLNKLSKRIINSLTKLTLRSKTKLKVKNALTELQLTFLITNIQILINRTEWVNTKLISMLEQRLLTNNVYQ